MMGACRAGEVPYPVIEQDGPDSDAGLTAQNTFCRCGGCFIMRLPVSMGQSRGPDNASVRRENRSLT
jgi:hypothetical protein